MDAPSAANPAYLLYLSLFAVAAAGCLAGAWRARRAGPPDVRRGLVSLLVGSGLWALFQTGVLLAPAIEVKTALYEAGLVVGFGTVWAWLWFCSSYSGRSLHRWSVVRWTGLALFLVVSATKLTNPWHGLYFSAEWAAMPFPHLRIDHHVLYWTTAALSYAGATVGFFMLIEPLRRAQVGTRRVAILFGLTALPLGANAIGYSGPYLLDLSHEPIGVAAFALGALFVYGTPLREAGRAGRQGKPAVVLSEDERIANYNAAAAEFFPALRATGATGSPLAAVLPRLAEVLSGTDEGMSLLDIDGPDGETRYVLPSESRFQRGPGRLVVLKDVTERERGRRERESRLEVLFEHSPDMINLHDAAGNLLEANSRFFEKTGYKDENLTEMKVWDLDASIDAERAAELWDGMRIGDRRQLEGMYRRADGSSFPVEIHIRRLRLEGEDRFMVISRDITQRKRRTRDLERYKRLIQSLPVGVFRTRVSGEFVDLNESLLEMYGGSEAELRRVGSKALYVDPQDREDLIRALRRDGKIEGKYLQLRTSSGNERAARLTVTLTEEDGAYYLDGIVQDVTDRLRRKERLERQNDLFEKAQEIADVGAWEYDVEQENLTLTDHAYRVHGLSPTDTVSPNRIHELYCSADRPSAERAFRRAVEEGVPYDIEARITTEEGERRWIRTRGEPQHKDDAPDGPVTRVRGAVQDVTDRKERERTRRERQKKVEALYEATDRLLRAPSSEAVGEILCRLVQEALGYPGASVRLVQEGMLVPSYVTKPTFTFMPERPAFPVDGESAVAMAYRSGNPLVIDDLNEVEAEASHDYGDLRSAIVVPMGDHGTLAVASPEPTAISEFDQRLIEILAVYGAAVLDRLGQERALQQAKEEAEEAARLKSAMLANMSHEIRTPLTSITGFAEVLVERLEGEPTVFAEKIQKGSRRLMNTLESVLHLSKLEADATQLARDEVPLGEVAEDVVEILRPRADEKALILTAETPDTPVTGRWNEDALRRICRNLLENAIKFTPEQGRVDVRVRTGENEAILEVDDTGIGMDPDGVDELFEAFKQESEGLGREFEGSGLGLSITKRLVEALDGTIDVETEKEKGTCFTVHLPMDSKLQAVGRD